MLLGSVSEKCARQAACPVLIVPAPAAERGTS
ncbi:universal stress protein [Arthrobacter sp. NPDC056886]